MYAKTGNMNQAPDGIDHDNLDPALLQNPPGTESKLPSSTTYASFLVRVFSSISPYAENYAFKSSSLNQRPHAIHL